MARIARKGVQSICPKVGQHYIPPFPKVSASCCLLRHDVLFRSFGLKRYDFQCCVLLNHFGSTHHPENKNRIEHRDGNSYDTCCNTMKNLITLGGIWHAVNVLHDINAISCMGLLARMTNSSSILRMCCVQKRWPLHGCRQITKRHTLLGLEFTSLSPERKSKWLQDTLKGYSLQTLFKHV